MMKYLYMQYIQYKYNKLEMFESITSKTAKAPVNVILELAHAQSIYTIGVR